MSLKLTQHGIKIYVTTTIEFKNLKEFLSKAQVEFYTHQLKDEKLSKFVLHGLPKFDLEKIKDELIAAKLNPCDIKMLNIKNSRYDYHANYFVCNSLLGRICTFVYIWDYCTYLFTSLFFIYIKYHFAIKSP